MLLVALALAGAVVCSILFGSRALSAADTWAVVSGDPDPALSYVRDVVEARVPRTVMGALVGAALAVSGVIIQSITRNPLGEPGLLGVTAGSSAAVVTAVAFLGYSGTARGAVWIALPGAVIAVIAVYLLGRPSKTDSVIPLVLAGAVISAVLYAYIQAMILTRPDAFDSYRHWVVGSLAGARFDTVMAVAPALVLGFVLALALSSGLNSLALGDDVATSLGVPVPWVRAGGIVAATLLAAGATAAVGPIAFIGLAVPHVMRALPVSNDVRWQIPLSALGGAALLLGSDVVARVIARPQELMVGVITAFVGAPFLLAAVRRGRAGA
ncbi:FecCD family ABC transporter permease [Micrococcaceae sp. AOP34-BR2-30]